MRRFTSIVALAALAYALQASPDAFAQTQTASAQSRHHAASRPAVKKPQAPRVSRPNRPSSGEIACTIAGCAPVPRGCHQEPGYTFDGEPTAFAIILCP